MHTTSIFTALACATFALAAPQPLIKRSSNCKYHPNQTEPVEMSSPAYILRVEDAHTNTSYGYLNAYSTDYAITDSHRDTASQAFNAPNWNTNEALIFWNGDQATERGLNLGNGTGQVDNASISPISTNGCGTRTTGLQDKYNVSRGSCGQAGKRVTAYLGCPAWGTTNDAGQECVEQKFFGKLITLVVQAGYCCSLLVANVRMQFA